MPQAALSGLPLVAYDCDGAGEVCIPDRSGILVKTGDTAGLRDAMIGMAENPHRRDEMGHAGRDLCLQRFPANVMVDKIEALYKKLMDRRK